MVPQINKKLELQQIGENILNNAKNNALKTWHPKTMFGKICKFLVTIITPGDVIHIIKK